MNEQEYVETLCELIRQRDKLSLSSPKRANIEWQINKLIESQEPKATPPTDVEGFK